MSRYPRFLTWFAALVVASAWSASASATLVLSFDHTNYAITPGDTVAVKVFVSQVAGGTQVARGNELISASIELSFATAGAAAPAGTSAVTYGTAWDQGFKSSSTSGSNTLYDVTLASVNGVADLSSPVLLATFTFTGLSGGIQGIQVAQQDPNSPDFITNNGDILDPTNIPTATITVTPATTVPEPGSLVLTALAAFVVVPVIRRRSR